MKRLAVSLLPACLAAAFAGPAAAQVTAAPAASAAASAPEARVARKPLSGQALRDSGTFPADLEPEAPRPQIKVPLGRKPPTSPHAASAVRPAGADGRRSGIDDGVARCKARSEPAAREACLRALSASDAAPR